MYNWIKYLELLIKNYFVLTGFKYDGKNLLQQKIPEQLWENIRYFIINLRNLPLWQDRSMSATIFGGKNKYEYWEEIFKTGKAPDGTMVLARPINVMEMI